MTNVDCRGGAPSPPETAKINIPKDKLADFCRRHHIHKLSLFGSALRDDFGPESDADMLVEFDPGQAEAQNRKPRRWWLWLRD